MDVSLIAYLKDGKYRLRTLELLNNKSMISSELALELNINRSSMSRILKNLKEKEVVQETESKSRTVLYTITELGKSVLMEMDL